MNVVGFDLFIHILGIHPPDAGFVPLQRTVDDMEAVAPDTVGKAHVGRAVKQHRVPRRREHLQRRDDASEDAVFVGDDVLGQIVHALALVPVDNGLVVGVTGREIAEGRVLRPRDDRVLNGAGCREVHVRHPHRDHVEARLRCARAETLQGL